MLDSLVEGKATAGAQESPDDVRKARSLCADGGAEWRCQLASLRQATRLAGECSDPHQIGRESLDVEEWGGWELELRWSGDGVEWVAS